MHDVWIVLFGLGLGTIVVRIGVAYVTHIRSLLAAQRATQSGGVKVDEVFLPGTALVFLVAGNVWLLVSRAGPGWSAAANVLFVLLLWLLAYIDARTTILPDALTGALAASGLVLHLCGSHDQAQDYSVYFAMVLGYVIPMLINAVYRCASGADADAIGQGDAKLLAGMGIWLGLHPLCMVIMSAAWLSLIYTLCKGLKSRSLPLAVPLGPFLALAGNIWIVKHV